MFFIKILLGLLAFVIYLVTIVFAIVMQFVLFPIRLFSEIMDSTAKYWKTVGDALDKKFNDMV